MAGRGVGTALLTGGLIAIALAGGASGYGLGHLTEPKDQPNGPAAPLNPGDGPTPTEPLNTAVPDPTPALRKSELRYKEREFVAEAAVRSRVTVEVPRNWRMTQPDPMIDARFTDPLSKRYVRIQAGFTIQRPPAESLAARIRELAGTPARQDLRIVSESVAADKRSATLVYTFVPAHTLRYAVLRWVALDESGNCAVEIGATGLIQDKDATWAVLERASESVTRSDSSL